MVSRREKGRVGTGGVAVGDLGGRERGVVDAKLVQLARELGISGILRAPEPGVHIVDLRQRAGERLGARERAALAERKQVVRSVDDDGDVGRGAGRGRRGGGDERLVLAAWSS